MQLDLNDRFQISLNQFYLNFNSSKSYVDWLLNILQSNVLNLICFIRKSLVSGFISG